MDRIDHNNADCMPRVALPCERTGRNQDALYRWRIRLPQDAQWSLILQRGGLAVNGRNEDEIGLLRKQKTVWICFNFSDEFDDYMFGMRNAWLDPSEIF